MRLSMLILAVPPSCFALVVQAPTSHPSSWGTSLFLPTLRSVLASTLFCYLNFPRIFRHPGATPVACFLALCWRLRGRDLLRCAEKTHVNKSLLSQLRFESCATAEDIARGEVIEEDNSALVLVFD